MASIPQEFDDNPFAAPESDLVPDELDLASAGLFRYATIWKRFFALVVDCVILRILTWIFALALGIVVQSGAITDPILMAFIAVAILIVMYCLYFALQECSEVQGTIGKRVMGLRVQTLDGRTVSFGQASVRWLGKLISLALFGIGYLLQPFTDRRQALHDMLAGTIVVSSPT